MRDLISRQAAIDGLMNDVTPYGLMDDDGNIESGCKDKDVVAMLYNLPSVQPERKKGRWLRGGSYPHHIFCSACYATYVPNDEWDIWKTDGMDCWRLPRKFCPNCGADMRNEQ